MKRLGLLATLEKEEKKMKQIIFIALTSIAVCNFSMASSPDSSCKAKIDGTTSDAIISVQTQGSHQNLKIEIDGQVQSTEVQSSMISREGLNNDILASALEAAGIAASDADHAILFKNKVEGVYLIRFMNYSGKVLSSALGNDVSATGMIANVIWRNCKN